MTVAGSRETVGAEPGRSRPPLRTPGNRAPRRRPHAAAMTIGLFHRGLVTQACARAIPPLRIARNEVIANASLRPISGCALRRRAQKSAGIGPVRRRPVTNLPSASHEVTNSPTDNSDVLSHAHRRASAGSWTPSVGPRVRTRETVNASGGAERTAPLIRHRPSSDPVAQLIGAVTRSTRGDVLIDNTIAGGCVYHASRLRTVGRDPADARHRTTRCGLGVAPQVNFATRSKN